VSTGQALTRLARVALGQAAVEAARSSPRGRGAMRSALGIEVLLRRGDIITNEHIDRLRDGLGV
jgi:hypothetical protein